MFKRVIYLRVKYLREFNRVKNRARSPSAVLVFKSLMDIINEWMPFRDFINV